jgi:catechol 2,3-dioxygenase-like lactoylglutathione lyase family enzyme
MVIRAADLRTAAKEKRAASLRPEFREETSAKADIQIHKGSCCSAQDSIGARPHIAESATFLQQWVDADFSILLKRFKGIKSIGAGPAGLARARSTVFANGRPPRLDRGRIGIGGAAVPKPSPDRLRSIGGAMRIAHVISQLRTTDLEASIRFYTTQLGLTLEFRHQDFYAGIRAGDQRFHLKRVDAPDPSIAAVDQGGHFHLYFEVDDAAAAADRFARNGVRLVTELHDMPWGTREFVIRDDQGHTLYFGQPR